eukprot:3720054-Pyramimonas_sp.AAC.1
MGRVVLSAASPAGRSVANSLQRSGSSQSGTGHVPNTFVTFLCTNVVVRTLLYERELMNIAGNV